MNILLALAPFIAFAIVDRLAGSFEGLLAGAIVSVGLLARDWLVLRHSPKILEIGSFVLFGGLALYVFLTNTDFSVMGVRLLVDGGLLLIVLISICLRTPFTIQYAREEVPPAVWGAPEFYRSNLVITSVWAAAFAVIVLADAVLLFMPDVPQRLGMLAIIAALVGAMKFTKWYPSRNKEGRVSEISLVRNRASSMSKAAPL